MTHVSTNSTEEFDTDGMVSLSATPSYITVQTAGVYLVSVTADFAANATGIRYARIVRIRSGAATALASSQIANVGASNDAIMSLSGMIECQANDSFAIGVFQNSGGALNMAGQNVEFGGTMICAEWVGRTS
jgi:hypothetical protein